MSTYAYVNPVVAVLLGWGFHNEPITKHTIIALCIILLGVFLINQSFRKAKKAV
ncbi:MAG: EamA family transporter [Cyclobacteriaceae bacterium]|nr:EamA family transporter [Cyclobacteriaceae bacterium]